MSEEINVGAISEALNGKLDRDLRNTQTPGRTIVESYADNAGNWYEVYSDGWCRQGGTRDTINGVINFYKPMYDTAYTALCVHNGSTEKGEGFVHCYAKTTTSMMAGLSNSTSGMYGISWEVEGKGAN